MPRPRPSSSSGEPSRTPVGGERLPHELLTYLAELRSRVHRYRRYGLLPEGRASVYLRTRRGSGLACVVCGESVLASEPEVVIECEPDSSVREPRVFRLHHLCHVIWLTACLPARGR